ncbi:MAG: GNAT family N-acetyltransferase, partial [Muribaculaceae bacterium]|nr:GNAT family N-acetyltransferase [Muribaculaceae bacterium]
LYDNYEIFYAVYNGEIISIAIMIFANGYLNYHLSGSKLEYRHLAPTNLLLYKAALWGHENGLRIFHLGGGIGSGEDSLYKFKSAFNRTSNYRFVVGKSIVNEDVYNRLLNLRTFTPEQEKNISFFPKYRATI